MRPNRIRSTLVCFRSLPPPRPLASRSGLRPDSPYDGLWQVTVVTKSGSCDAQTTLDRECRRRQDFGRPGFRQRRQRGTCASLDQWCICERSTQWQLRIGEMEWRFSWCSRAAVDGKRPVSKPSRTSAIFRQRAAADICSRRVFFGGRFAASPEPCRSPAPSPAWPATGPAAAPSRWTTARASGSAAAPPTMSPAPSMD